MVAIGSCVFLAFPAFLPARFLATSLALPFALLTGLLPELVRAIGPGFDSISPALNSWSATVSGSTMAFSLRSRGRGLQTPHAMVAWHTPTPGCWDAEFGSSIPPNINTLRLIEVHIRVTGNLNP